MTRTKASVLEERLLDVLAYLFDQSYPQRHYAIVSNAQIEAELELSPMQRRYALRHLEQDGYILVHPRYTSQGGQLSNAYSFTSKSLEALANGYLGS